MNYIIPHKIRYIIFIGTIIIAIIANELIVQYNMDLQLTDAKTINMAGKQRMLSQRISKEVLLLDGEITKKDKNILIGLSQEMKKAHELLVREQSEIENIFKLKTLFKTIQPYYLKIQNSSKVITATNNLVIRKQAIKEILESEPSFLNLMDEIVFIYQINAGNKLKKTKNIVSLLSCLSVLILIGEFVFIIIPFSDKLNKKNKELNLNNRRLSDFAHISSHNLRAPIGNITSLLDIYDNCEDTEEKKGLVTKLKIVSSHLNDTMDTLLNALSTNHKSNKEIAPIKLSEILLKTKEILETQINISKIDIKSDFTKINNINYNKLYIDSIFLNLVSNAIKYKSLNKSAKLIIKSYKHRGKTVLTFADNGLGINMARHGDRLFGLNNTFHRHEDAKGVGLFITRTQIESLGGSIIATSVVDKGTTFKIIL